jgi:hypothetical protein
MDWAQYFKRRLVEVSLSVGRKFLSAGVNRVTLHFIIELHRYYCTEIFLSMNYDLGNKKEMG